MPGSSRDSQNQTEECNQQQAIRSSLLAWASWVVAKSEQTLALHHCLLLNQLTSVCRGDIDRLMVLMPPGSAKSTYTSAYNVFAAHNATNWTMVSGHGIYDMPGVGTTIYPGSFIADPHDGSQPATWQLGSDGLGVESFLASQIAGGPGRVRRDRLALE